MAAEGTSQLRTLLIGRQDLLLPMVMIASVLVILVPLPPLMLDLLLATNISISVLMLLTTIFVRTPLEFSIFPSLLLATTLGRLVLNVASTRLILTHAGDNGLSAAGDVIRAFGEFVAGDRIVVGLIIFAIIVLIQFVVITKGATRISEVAARFALDGMPGRQMAIDADLQARAIDEKEAQRRRLEITRQADFFGAMDGASKFVRGDAIAGIVITLINIVGGFCIGVFDAGMTLAESAEVFTKLTIGDGLVSQVPAFLISLAAGLLVTRSSTDTNLPIEFIGQLFSRPQALAVTGGFLGLLIFTDLPTIPLFLIAAGCLALALKLRSQRQQVKAAQEAKARAQAPPAAEQRLEDLLHVDPMEVELGARLIRLADPKRGGQLMERIQGVRQQIAAELGIVLPKVRIRDNPGLDREQYRIKLSDVPVADGQLRPDLYLAIDLAQQGLKINGLKTTDPAFGAPAVWIDETQIDAAKMAGFVVAEPVSVLATHFQEVVRRHADEILTRDATKQLVEELKKTSPAVVEELVPKHMTLAEVQQVLQMLLREGVPIRQLATILETLGDFAARAAKDPVLLTEQVRFRLARAICSKYRDAEKRLFVVTLDPKLEDRLRAGIQHTERGLLINMSPQAIRSTCDQIAKELHKLQLRGLPPVILVSPQIRAGLKQLTQPHLPKLVVLSFNEITRDTVIESVGNVVEGAPA